MTRKNQYVLYLDRLEKFIDNYILKADITVTEKDERLNTVYALISSCVPYYAEHALSEVMWNVTQEARKARAKRMDEELQKRRQKLASSCMKKVTKKKRY